MTASLTVAWRSGGSPTIGPVEACERERAKTWYKSHTPRTGGAGDFVTVAAQQAEVDGESEDLNNRSNAAASHQPRADRFLQLLPA